MSEPGRQQGGSAEGPEGEGVVSRGGKGARRRREVTGCGSRRAPRGTRQAGTWGSPPKAPQPRKQTREGEASSPRCAASQLSRDWPRPPPEPPAACVLPHQHPVQASEGPLCEARRQGGPHSEAGHQGGPHSEAGHQQGSPQ